VANANDTLVTLDSTELDFLEALGARRKVAAGEYLYRAGDADYDFYAVLSATVDILAGVGGDEHIVARHSAGRFLGELSLLTRQRGFVSARVSEPGEVVAVPYNALRRVIADNPRLSDKILAAFIARRDVLLSGTASTLRVIGCRFATETARLREFLVRSRIPHDWLDPDGDATVEALVHSFGIEPADLPVAIMNGTVLANATPGTVAEYLGLTVGSLPDRSFDLVVVGSGPAGLAAAVYGASEGLRTLTLESEAIGGQARSSSRIENYLGFPTGISGADLIGKALVQAEKFGAFVASPSAAGSLREVAGHLVLQFSDGTEVGARAVIAATGARYRRLDLERREWFERDGIYYAATELEARLCADSPVVVVGGGNSAGQAAMFLAETASHVTLIVRGPDLGAQMSRYLVDRIEGDKRICVRTGTSIIGVVGDDALRGVRLRGMNGESTLTCAAVFSFIGAEPASEWLSGCAALDEHGFVLTDRSLQPRHLDGRWATLARGPLPFETSQPGLFAVGDVRSGSTKRVAAAVGEGSAAVRSVHDYLAFAH
jgi:thioredoxin reductase (NADPH)